MRRLGSSNRGQALDSRVVFVDPGIEIHRKNLSRCLCISHDSWTSFSIPSPIAFHSAIKPSSTSWTRHSWDIHQRALDNHYSVKAYRWLGMLLGIITLPIVPGKLEQDWKGDTVRLVLANRHWWLYIWLEYLSCIDYTSGYSLNCTYYQWIKWWLKIERCDCG